MDKLDRLGCDPIEGMAKLALNQLPCGWCDGRGYLDDADGGTSPCKVCTGRGRERVEPDLRGRMYAELAQYVYPKRKAVEHSGPDGEAPSFRVMLERARKRAGLED